MPERAENANSSAGLPWAFVLDPAANAAALGDVQRRGLEAARRLVNRAIARSDHSTNASSDRPNREEHPGGEPQPGDPLVEIIRCWTELMTRVLGKLAEGGDGRRSTGTDRAGSTTVAVDGSDHGGVVQLRLEVDQRGRLSAGSELRLSNPSDRPIGPLGLHVDDLYTPDGDKLAGASVQFDPPVIEELAPGSSRVVAVGLSMKGALNPGTYRGIVQSAGAPGLVLTVQVVVLPDES
jgi:hypothetical protein